MTVTIIGIDCATRAEKTGLALGSFDEQGARLELVSLGSGEQPVSQTIAQWMAGRSAVLLALDAPLGWPIAMAQALCCHEAGAPIQAAPDDMFRRATDREIRHRLKKQSLDVGADRIARTAHAALRLLQGLRDVTGAPIPLAWEPTVTSPCAIEVYPAATLASHKVEAEGYKQEREGRGHRALLAFLASRLALPSGDHLLSESTDALDAALCFVAGVDFLKGAAVPPSYLPLAKKEGWIWAP